MRFIIKILKGRYYYLLLQQSLLQHSVTALICDDDSIPDKQFALQPLVTILIVFSRFDNFIVYLKKNEKLFNH